MNQEITTEALILSSLVLDDEFVRQTLPYYSPDYFYEKTDKVVFEIIKAYLDKYNTRPNRTTLLVDIKERTNLNEEELKDVENYIHTLFKIDRPPDKSWLLKNAEEFCQSRSVKNAIMQSIRIYDGDDKTKTTHAIPDLIKEAISVSFDNHIGMDFYTDTESRFNYYNEPENRIEFDIDVLNKVTGGGVAKKTLNIILAGVHVGKSLTLVHLASAYAKAGYNVLYISNEMSQQQVFLRIDANLLNIPSDKITSLGFEKFNSRVEKLKSKNYGTIKVKDYAPGSAHCGHFKHILHELRLKQRFVPDVVLVDYLGIVASSRQKSANTGSHGYLTSVAEELRALAFDFDIPVWTAQQLNRCLFHKTPINTENGYKPLDELVVGDNIIGSNGNVVVEHIYPIEEQECYEITLKSGKKIICSDKHLFPTNNGLKSIETGLIIGDSFYVKCFNEHILVEILLIIPVGIKKTIDITVSGDNLFFANDILTHNSGASSTDAEMTDIGGCIALDSLVTEKTRGEIKISELTVGDEIKTHNDKWTTVKLIHHPIKKKGFKIKLKSGKYITASAEHVFPTNKGRLPTSKLEIGMKLNHNGVV